MTLGLPAFAADRRALVPLLLGVGARRCRSIFHGRTALLLSIDGTDRRTDRPFRIDPVPHTMQAVSAVFTRSSAPNRTQDGVSTQKFDI